MKKTTLTIMVTILTLLTPGLSLANDCRFISGWPPGSRGSDFIEAPQEIIDFINEETGGLYFRRNATVMDFKRRFNMVSSAPGDRTHWWGRSDGRWIYGFSQGEWLGAQVRIVRGTATFGGAEGYTDAGPIYLGNGIGYVRSFGRDNFPKEVRIFQHLDTQYRSEDIFRAIRKKLNVPNSQSCIYQGYGSIGGRMCSSGRLLFSHQDRYFKIGVLASGMANHRQGDGRLTHSVIDYKIEDYTSAFREYQDCIQREHNIRKRGQDLSL